MAIYTAQQIINRAKLYVNDNHAVTTGAVMTPTDWLDLLNVEVQEQYRKSVRNGLVKPIPQVATWTGSTYASSSTFDVPMVVIDVVEDKGSYYRPLLPAQSVGGSYTNNVPTNTNYGIPVVWNVGYDMMPGTTNSAFLRVNLFPPATNGNYRLRYIPETDLLGLTDVVKFTMAGGDDRIALGMAQRALMRESASNQVINKKIDDLDKEMDLAAKGFIFGDGPRVRLVKPRVNPRRVGDLRFDYNIPDPSSWTWL